MADVPLGLDKWMDISGNILSMRLITSSTYLRGRKKHGCVNGTLVNDIQTSREPDASLFNLIFMDGTRF